MRDHKAVQREREMRDHNVVMREMRDHMAVNRYERLQGSRDRER